MYHVTKDPPSYWNLQKWLVRFFNKPKSDEKKDHQNWNSRTSYLKYKENQSIQKNTEHKTSSWVPNMLQCYFSCTPGCSRLCHFGTGTWFKAAEEVHFAHSLSSATPSASGILDIADSLQMLRQIQQTIWHKELLWHTKPAKEITVSWLPPPPPVLSV